MSGIFALVCPECGVSFEDQPDAAGHATDAADDVVAHDLAHDAHVCVACTCRVRRAVRVRLCRSTSDRSRGRVMRIAQVAPLFESVPPALYGGTERVIAALADGMVAAGHDVTLFGAGSSNTGRASGSRRG